MKSLVLALLAVVGASTSLEAQGLTADMQRRIAAIDAKVVAWRRDIHQHPELGNRETRTAKIVADHLRALGIEVQTGVAHTGVVGLLRGGRPGPVVLLRADMDGLPVTERVKLPFASTVKAQYNGQEVGVMHACGHDTHVAILMGTAEILAGMKNELAGTVKFMFQPAEEGAPLGEQGGADLMVKEGILDNPKVDVGFALHINSKREVNTIGYTPGGIWASADDYRIVVKGKQTHGAAPWNGVDPIVIGSHIVTALQTIVSRSMDITENASIVTVGKFTAGVRFNIIPEDAELVGTIRALSKEDRAKIHELVRRTATNIAEAMGGTAEVTVPLSTAYPVTVNDPALTAAMVPALQAVAGAGKLHLIKAQTGSEDFSFIADRVPGLYIDLGGRPSNVPEAQAADHHTPDFFVDDSGLGLGVKAMTALTLHYMKTNPRVTP